MQKAKIITPEDMKQIILSGLFAAIAFVLPMIFHLLGLGSIFLPMFLPIVMLAFLVKLQFAIVVCIIVPIFSTLTTSMPPIYPPIFLIMIMELLVICVIISLTYHRLKYPWYVALIASVIVDRLTLALMIFILLEIFKVKGLTLSSVFILQGIPGICLQFIVVPLFLKLYKLRYGVYPVRN